MLYDSSLESVIHAFRRCRLKRPRSNLIGWPHGRALRMFVITTDAGGPDGVELHNRMPVILDPTDWPASLGESEGDPASATGSTLRGVAGGSEAWQSAKQRDLIERAELARVESVNVFGNPSRDYYVFFISATSPRYPE